jgi:AraC-like DNA-binding protein
MLGRARAQVWAYSPHYRRPRHFHAEPELNCIAAGSARFGVGDTVVQASAGELLVFPPGQDHVMLGGSQDLVLYAVGLEPELAAEVLRGATLVGATAMHVRPRADDFRVMAARAAALSGCDARPQDVAELWERAHRSRRQQVAGRGGEWHVLTRRTLETLATAPELGRAALARHVRGSESEVSRHFHRDVGMTLVQYRTRVRLLRFIREVDEHAGNLLKSAGSSGFGSYSQCHRAFRAEFCCAPQEFFASGVRAQMEGVFEPESPLWVGNTGL